MYSRKHWNHFKIMFKKNLLDCIEKFYLKQIGTIFKPNVQQNNIDVIQVTLDVLKDTTGFELNGEDVLNMPHMEYFKRLDTLLRQTPERDLENYLTFREFVSLMPSTTSIMRRLFHRWSSIRTGIDVPPAR